MMPSPQTQEHAPNGLSYVEELPSDFTECTVFLDVDGTLAPDGSFDFSPAVLAKVGEWKQTNEVLLCTNKRGKERWQKLESLFGLPVVTKEHRKPSKKVLQGIRPRFAQLVEVQIDTNPFLLLLILPAADGDPQVNPPGARAN